MFLEIIRKEKPTMLEEVKAIPMVSEYEKATGTRPKEGLKTITEFLKIYNIVIAQEESTVDMGLEYLAKHFGEGFIKEREGLKSSIMERQIDRNYLILVLKDTSVVGASIFKLLKSGFIFPSYTAINEDLRGNGIWKMILTASLSISLLKGMEIGISPTGFIGEIDFPKHENDSISFRRITIHERVGRKFLDVKKAPLLYIFNNREYEPQIISIRFLYNEINHMTFKQLKSIVKDIIDSMAENNVYKRPLEVYYRHIKRMPNEEKISLINGEETIQSVKDIIREKTNLLEVYTSSRTKLQVQQKMEVSQLKL